MFVYIVTRTSPNYTLIPQTDGAIIDACRHLFEKVHHIKVGVDKARDSAFLLQLAHHNQRGEEYLVFDTNGKSNFEIHGKKFIRNRLSYISDAPFSIWPFINRMDRRAIITYSDKGHRQFLDDVGYNKPSFFMPHGGPELEAADRDFVKRDIDLLVIGRIQNPQSLDDIIACLGHSSFLLRKILSQAFEKALYENVEPYIALKNICHENGLDILELLPQDELFILLNSFSEWLEMTNRNKLLQNLKDVKIDFIGPARDDVTGVTDMGHNFHGTQYGEASIKYIRRAKVVLNSVSVFPGGSHERIWFAMAHGAAVFTDYSHFVAETFKDEENILFIDNSNHAASVDKLRNAMEYKDKLACIAEKSNAIYAGHHTWGERLKGVMPKVINVIATDSFEIL